VIGCVSLLVAFLAGAGDISPIDLTLLAVEGIISICCGLVFVVKMSHGLERAVRLLQPLAGKPEPLLRRYLGAPTDREDGGPDGQLLTWREPGYVVTLAFRDGICQRVVREEITED
jgi:hypothetical protein